MATINGPNLQVSRISVSLTGRISLYFATPYVAPLFLGLLVLTPNPSVPTFKGKIIPGTDEFNGGSCSLLVNPSLLTSIGSFLQNHTGLEAALVYDEKSLSVSDVNFSSAQATVPLQTHVAMLDAHVGIGNVNAELKAVHLTLKDLLETVHGAAPPDSRRRGRLGASEPAPAETLRTSRVQKKRAK